MPKFETLKMVAAALVLAAAVTPAMADHDHDDNDHRDRHERRHSRHFWHKQARLQQSNGNITTTTTTTYPSDWNGQRVYFSSNWDHRNPSFAAADSAALELEMKNSWNAYHKNGYTGAYTWNTYNNPEFFDYVHTNNPSLFTQVRRYISN